MKYAYKGQEYHEQPFPTSRSYGINESYYRGLASEAPHTEPPSRMVDGFDVGDVVDAAFLALFQSGNMVVINHPTKAEKKRRPETKNRPMQSQ